ncbi:uncharacterized protein LOC131726640 isoform X2 [Acipenser ruthenus]|uniref:uncharacterized protein LOC131726640 isoform X2 n=1 Tax=Acipenser ruthenus TaxID=7906 RepID=UPI0027417360|nr:uncharacterized protein LOC131726640 isoform X2 [Acipenser ruthenus]
MNPPPPSVGNGQHPADHTRPFFYIQPSQPYFPYQWHMQNPYNPYMGFPGSGYNYGYQHLPPNPYGELPGYIVPHAQLHPADCRRMFTPHFPPTMAYHARRFRYQQNTMHREMTSSEVQTEPNGLLNNSEHSGSTETCDAGQGRGSDSGLGTKETNSPSSAMHSGSLHSDGQKQSGQDKEASPSKSRGATPNSYVFQKEEVRIECTDMPTALKIFRSRKTTSESTQNRSNDLVQCDVWSVSSTEGVLPLYSSVHEGSAMPNTECPEEHEQCVPVFPDVLLLGAPPSDNVPTLAEKKRNVARECVSRPENALQQGQLVDQDSRTVPNKLTDEKSVERNVGEKGGCLINPVKNICCEIIQLPNTVEQLERVNESVWSVETLAPYFPPVGSLLHQGVEVNCESASKNPSLEKIPEVDRGDNVNQEPSLSRDEARFKIVKLPFEQRIATGKDLQQHDESICSVESLPTYVPAASWLSDFGNLYFCSKLPQAAQQLQSASCASADHLSSREKQISECEDASRGFLSSCAYKERRRQNRKADVQGNADDEKICKPCFNKNVSGTKEESEIKNCTHCLSKLNLHDYKKSKAAKDTEKSSKLSYPTPADLNKQTCEACKCALIKVVKKKKGPGSKIKDYLNEENPGEETTEDEVAVSEIPKKSCTSRKVACVNKTTYQMRLSEPCPVARQFPKKKAKKGSCDETKCVSHHDAQEQSHPDVVKECYEECATMLKPDACKGPEKKNVAKQIQTEIPWKENMVATDKGSWDRSGARPRNFNNPWKSYPQPRNTEQERCHWKKVPRRPGVYQRPWRDERDETYEGEFPRPHRGRGYSKRRGTRY